MGPNAGPRNSWASAPGTRMPSTNPAGSSSTRAGTRRRGATIWQAVATAMMSVMPSTTCESVRAEGSTR